MILVLTAIGLIIVGFIVWLVTGKEDGSSLILVGIILAFLMLIGIGAANEAAPYQNEMLLHKQYALEYMIERVKDPNNALGGLATKQIISDVVNWNADIRKMEHYTNSQWTNWFYPEKVLDGIHTINYEVIP